ncbi:MAG TPA: molybdopterin dinucleotide binding domain-containing protein, partial [Symbiobacteriaceae bacterium]|nr:molybdopterin dinucleotide binding domain-containing protein [Symbiobacteriaceae bacterium]
LTAWESRQFPTPSGKFELRSSAAAAAGFPDLPVYVPPVPAPPDFPIRLLTPHPPDSLHSQFHSQKLVLRVSARPVLEMHPDLAGRIGLADGDMVRVYNTRGELHLPIRLTRTVQPDTVVAYEGAYADQPYNVNLLTGPAPPGVPFPGTPFGDSFVAVEPSPRGG